MSRDDDDATTDRALGRRLVRARVRLETLDATRGETNATGSWVVGREDVERSRGASRVRHGRGRCDDERDDDGRDDDSSQGVAQ